ncbi:tRNA 2'-phosphotransferase 1 [Perkinsus chesapeaki]|uniref:2'-phosphotransferase n=1 Tax=Perkinsus chesapeaki TaxID=330153 RepID=A0A7J6LZJ0_PERCH|nr:tRNA 2'-phosphotransferase 1 [Perkinsus chesapeaki]
MSSVRKATDHHRQRHNRREMSSNEAVSRLLSKVLRHKAVDMGLAIDRAGYVKVNDLLVHPRFKSLKVSEDDIKQCVATNAKQRFALTTAPDGELLIRATQGHSFPSAIVDPTLIMTPVSMACLPPLLVHGTYFSHWKAILASGGLKPMSRQHIHLVDASETLTGVVSGLRKSAEIYVYVDAKRAAEDHIPFLRSANNVYLTSGKDGLLGTQYFKKVVDVKESAEAKKEYLLNY